MVFFWLSSPTIIQVFTKSCFIYLLLYSQSCCTVATMAGVLSSACSGTSEPQLSALLSLHKKLVLSQEEKPSSMLKGVEDSLNSLSKVRVCQLPFHSWFMDAVRESLLNSLDGRHYICAVMAFALSVMQVHNITWSIGGGKKSYFQQFSETCALL